MVELIEAAYQQYAVFWLLFGRIGAFVFAAPPFSTRYVPIPVRVFFALFLSLLFLPLMDGQVVDTRTLPYFAMLVKEIVIGLALGFFVQLMFVATQVAGQLLDVEMGLGLANLFDPVYVQPLPLMGQFLYTLTLLLFFSLGGMQEVVAAMYDSLLNAPPGIAFLSAASSQVGVQLFAWMFFTAIRIALPVLAAVFLCNIVLAVLARAIPQMNAFILGLQLKAIVVLFGLFLIMPGLIALLGGAMREGLSFLYRLPLSLT